MTNPADVPSENEVEELSKLLDSLIDRPLRTVVEPALKGVGDRLAETRDALGTLVERADEHGGRLDEIAAGRDQIFARCDALARQLSHVEAAQAALGESLLAAMKDLAQYAEADRVDLRRRLRVHRVLISATVLAAIAFTILFEVLRA